MALRPNILGRHIQIREPQPNRRAEVIAPLIIPHPQHGTIGRQKDGGAAGPLRSLDDPSLEGTIAHRVHLHGMLDPRIPLHARGADLFDGVVGEGGDGHVDPPGCAGSRRGELAIWMSDRLDAGGGDAEREGDLAPKARCGCGHGGDGAEHARAEAVFLEGEVVGVEGDLVCGAGIVELCRGSGVNWSESIEVWCSRGAEDGMFRGRTSCAAFQLLTPRLLQIGDAEDARIARLEGGGILLGHCRSPKPRSHHTFKVYRISKNFYIALQSCLSTITRLHPDAPIVGSSDYQERGERNASSYRSTPIALIAPPASSKVDKLSGAQQWFCAGCRGFTPLSLSFARVMGRDGDAEMWILLACPISDEQAWGFLTNIIEVHGFSSPPRHCETRSLG